MTLFKEKKLCKSHKSFLPLPLPVNPASAGKQQGSLPVSKLLKMMKIPQWQILKLLGQGSASGCADAHCHVRGQEAPGLCSAWQGGVGWMDVTPERRTSHHQSPGLLMQSCPLPSQHWEGFPPGHGHKEKADLRMGMCFAVP